VPLFHDTAVRDALRTRVQSLTPDAPRQWGTMAVDQMLWHVNESLCSALGEKNHELIKGAIPAPLLKFIVVNFPWPKGAPTYPGFVAGDRYDFAAELTRCLRLIDTFASRSIEGPWPDSPVFGPVNGRFVSRLQAKHLDHHLKQFGA